MRIHWLFGCLLLVFVFTESVAGYEPLSNEEAVNRAKRLVAARNRGLNALLAAARDNKLEKLRALIGEGADVNARPNGNGVTALMEAANQGYVESIDVLIAAGADPSVEMWNGWTALAFAAQNGKVPAIRRLLAASPPPTQRHLQLALFAAAVNGRPASASELVRSGADLNATVADGVTPLMLAAKNGHPKTIARLLSLGAKVNAQDGKGQTALMWAARQGRENVVAVLLDAGADAELRDKRGMTAFPANSSPQARLALMRRQWTRITVQPKSCSLLLGMGIVAKGPKEPIVAGYGLYRPPAAGAAAQLVPNDGGPVVSVKIGKVTRAETDGGPPEWNATLEPQGQVGKILDRGHRTGVLVWPAPESRLRLVTPKPDELPYGLYPEAVEAAVDTDGDGKADALSLQYCCKNSSSADKCEYYCRDYWQRDAGTWRRCQSSGPA